MINNIINEITSIEHEVCMEYLKKYPEETTVFRDKLEKLFQQYDKHIHDVYDVAKSDSD